MIPFVNICTSIIEVHLHVPHSSRLCISSHVKLSMGASHLQNALFLTPPHIYVVHLPQNPAAYVWDCKLDQELKALD